MCAPPWQIVRAKGNRDLSLEKIQAQGFLSPPPILAPIPARDGTLIDTVPDTVPIKPPIRPVTGTRREKESEALPD